ncbi:integral membrane protein [Chlamydia abortus]|uniref:YggT family protein n=1 Tax=Paenibacillus residui TaxID=629724 RepID=A0ABW3DIK5_9BACL|nr:MULTISPECIES: YggT family protein [Paenibacillaceae]SHE10472.1 integral membrane protein [Chlamydia abortus]
MNLSDINSLIGTLIQIYTYLIIAYVLLSWLPNARESFIGELLGKIVEPYLSIFRKFIPPIGGMLDLSPIIALIALRFVGYGIFAIIEMIVGGF